MPRLGLRCITAVVSCALTVGCAQESPLGSSNPATAPSAELLRSAVRVHVDLVKGTAVTVSQDARSAGGAGVSFALVGHNELRVDVVGAIRRSAVGEFTKKKVRVQMDVALTNLLSNAAFVAPSFPAPPASGGGLLLFPFSTTVTSGIGLVTPGTDWNGNGAAGSGAPVNFFNDLNCSSDVKTDCYRWEEYPAPLTGGASTAAQTVGFDVDPTVLAFDTYFVLAADLGNNGVVNGRITVTPIGGGPEVPFEGATVNLMLTLPGGGTLGTLTTSTDADGNYLFPSVTPNSPLPDGFSSANGDGYTVEVIIPICGGTRDVSSTGETLVQAGRTTTTSFLYRYDCSLP